MFNSLRTNKQLGYIVSMGTDEFGRTKGGQSLRGFTARILSNRFNPWEMQEELGSFLASHKAFVCDTLTEEDVRSRADAIITTLRDPPTRYIQESSQFYSAILNERPFDWDEQIVLELQNITLADVQECYCKWFLGKIVGGNGNGDESEGGRSARKSVSVMMFGKEHRGKGNGGATPASASTPSEDSESAATPDTVFPRSSLNADYVSVVTITDLGSLAGHRKTLSFYEGGDM